MKSLVAPVTLLLVLAAAPARGDLRTRSMDAVRAEVELRVGELTKPLDRQEKKAQAVYRTVLLELGKKSRSARTDATRIRNVVVALDRLHPDDAEMQGLLAAGLDGFLSDLRGELKHVQNGLDACDDANPRKTSAQSLVDDAAGALDAAEAELDPMQEIDVALCAVACRSSVKRLDAAHRATDKAILKDPAITTHQDAVLRVMPQGYQGGASCLLCHEQAGKQMLASVHWRWAQDLSDVEGLDGAPHGKRDLLNNFCIAVPSNEGRCTQCHVGVGWKDGTFDFEDPSAIDCLVCHDTTGLYKKDTKTAGAPVAGIDLQHVAMNVGRPGRANCGACHFYAGGGDNVKVGDMASTLANPTRVLDVHMGTDGPDMVCQDCHGPGPAAGKRPAPVDRHAELEGSTACTQCHGPAGSVHQSATLSQHTAKVACETCHIPTFSRGLPTKVSWDWSTAGQTVSPIPVDAYGKPTYDKMKGTFVWAKDVRPDVLWHDGRWTRTVVNVNDTFTATPVVLARPVAVRGDPGAKLYPFKRMVGRQPADAVLGKLIVPHLFGTAGGPKPYWTFYDWAAALAEGAAYAGQEYSGQYTFVETVMYLGLHHEVAPASQARACSDCHGANGLDWAALGYPGDPNP